VKTRFQNMLSKCNLRRYAAEWLGKAGTFLDSDFSLAALCVAGGHGGAELTAVESS
jgi:hypothetical protein